MWPDSVYPRGILQDEERAEDLLAAFEEMADERADDAAIFLKDPRVRGAEVRYLSLSFGELRLERDAWMHRLRGAGVTDEDRVLIWLPQGLAMVAAAYALLRIGVEVAIADESMELGAGLCGFEPTVVLGSSVVCSRSRRWMSDTCQFLEIRSPLLRVSAGVRSSEPRRLARREIKSGVTFFRDDLEGVRRAVRFDAESISSSLAAYREALSIRPFEIDLPIDCFMSLLNPALGVSSVYTEAGFGEKGCDSVDALLGAIEDLGVSRLTRTLEQCEEILRVSETRGDRYDSVRQLFVVGSVSDVTCLGEELRERFPEADLYSVFGTVTVPIVSVCGIGDGRSFEKDTGVGERIGALLPGLRAKVAEGALRTSGIGELSIEGILCGSLLLEGEEDGAVVDRSGRTGYFAFEDDAHDLWLCGRTDQAVQTGFGTFIPARCEPVFESHPKVLKVTLVGLRSKARTRPGIVIEVDDGCLPKDALAEAKFRAELLQLGAESADTKLILDMFFVDRLPDQRERSGGIDRAALSRRYSMLAKLREVF